MQATTVNTALSPQIQQLNAALQAPLLAMTDQFIGEAVVATTAESEEISPCAAVAIATDDCTGGGPLQIKLTVKSGVSNQIVR